MNNHRLVRQKQQTGLAYIDDISWGATLYVSVKVKWVRSYCYKVVVFILVEYYGENASNVLTVCTDHTTPKYQNLFQMNILRKRPIQSFEPKVCDKEDIW